MKITFDLTDQQEKFLEDHPDVDLQKWLRSELDKKIKQLWRILAEGLL
jgi:hypothetical protein